MTLRDRLSAFAARWVKPADAARVVSKHGAQARALTLAERKAKTTAELQAFVDRRAELQQKGAS